MNVAALKPPEPPAHTLADWSEVQALQERMVESVEEMTRLAGDVAVARQIKDYNSELRKRVLAVAAAPLMKAGSSATAAETEARASDPYRVALDQLAKQLATAEQTLATWEVLRLRWETARSLISLQKEGMRTL